MTELDQATAAQGFLSEGMAAPIAADQPMTHEAAAREAADYEIMAKGRETRATEHETAAREHREQEAYHRSQGKLALALSERRHAAEADRQAREDRDKATEYRRRGAYYKNEALLTELSWIICDGFWQATGDREAIEAAFHVLHTHQRSN